jgi:hypothetical protein
VQEMVRAITEALTHGRPELSRTAPPAHPYARRSSASWTVAESPHAPTAQGGEQQIEALELAEVA